MSEKIKKVDIAGVCLQNIFHARDLRGSFVKLFQKQQTDIELRDIFFSRSQKNVIRGMHFQRPPYEALKLVSVIQGKVLDVVLDLRKSSPTYLKYQTFELSSSVPQGLIIPAGVAHGFLSLENNSTMVYCTTREYMPEYDDGILYDSFGFDWPLPSCDIITSDRDKKFVPLSEFQTPFA